ncbi:MAG: DUF4199 domain-containing protein [Bacteroidota bacterium]
MRNFTATQKGLITGAAMIVNSFLIYNIRGSFTNNLQYITYSLYVAGILWTLIDFSKAASTDTKFGGYFSQGFKCFIVVTLLMVLFTAGFLLMHPEMKEQMAAAYKADLIKGGNSTPSEIEDKIAMAKKSFMPVLLMGAIFGYLVIGAIVTALTSAILMQTKKIKNQG